MRFGNLDYLWLLFLIPVMTLFYMWAFSSKRKALHKFANDDMLKHLLNSVSFAKQRLKPVLFLSGVLFVIIALVQPKWGFLWKEVKRRGLDIVVAIDVSKSMLAEDIKPNRIQVAKREIKSLINILTGDRIGIVAFSGSAFLHCPLTLDYGTAKLFLDNLSVGSIPLGGTDIGEAILKSVRAYEGHEKKHRVLILITDGEDLKGRAMEAVGEAKKQGIVIFTIGIGRKEGAPIPYYDDKGRKSFVKDSDGRVVLSKLDTVLLQKIALMTGGKKGSIGVGSFPLEEIYRDEVSKMEKRELESSKQKWFGNRYQWPLFIAVFFFVFEAVLSERKKTTKKGAAV